MTVIPMSASTRGNARVVDISPGVGAASPQFWKGEVNGLAVELEIVAEACDEDRPGRFVCRSLNANQLPGGPPVTTAAMRDVHVAEIIRGACVNNVFSIERDSDGGWKASSKVLTDELVAKFKAEGPTDETLWWVSHLYRLALAVGHTPAKEVAGWLGIPRSTTARWISKARERGFLGASRGRGKAADRIRPPTP